MCDLKSLKNAAISHATYRKPKTVVKTKPMSERESIPIKLALWGLQMLSYNLLRNTTTTLATCRNIISGETQPTAE